MATLNMRGAIRDRNNPAAITGRCSGLGSMQFRAPGTTSGTLQVEMSTSQENQYDIPLENRGERKVLSISKCSESSYAV
ncbi:hypothetical protein PM082_002288 [Marasmius tenuissimus]|nr:hypothetical protein PM082_002288 [Marasmius tenuissimus]